MKLRTVAAAVFVTLAVVAVAAAAPGTRRPPIAVFAVEQDPSVARIGDAHHLVRLDSVTLERLGPMSFSLAHTRPYTASPRGRFLAFGSVSGSGRPYVRLVDGREFRPLGSARVAPVLGEIRALEWTRSNHVFAAGDNFVALVNPSTRRLVWSKRLRGEHMLVHKTATGIVQLRAPKDRIGRATLAIADARRGLRVTQLRIRAGRRRGFDSASSTMRHPGLAVDTAGRRAFLVDTDHAVAIVDLASLRTRYVRLRPPARPIGANAFIQTGYWMGNGKLAVGGWDEPPSPSAPLITAGFRLIDIGNGKARTIGRRVNLLHFDGHSLLAEENDALVAYAPDGTRRFTVPMPGAPMEFVGRYAYIIGDGTDEGRKRRTIVDLDTGAIVNRLEPPFWRTPVAEAAP